MTEHDRSLRRTALLVSTMASFLTPFMASALNVAMPVVAKEFSLSAVALGWVPTAYMLAAAMFLVPFGRLADIVGRKRVFVSGVAVFGLGSLLSALAPTGHFFIASRAVQGVGGAMVFGTGMAILTSVFPARERGRAIGINTAAVYVGLSSGPVVGGFLTHSFGWRSVLWVTLPMALAVFLVTSLKLKGEWAEARGEGFDWRGSLAYGLGLVCLMSGFSRLPSLLGLSLTAAGLAALSGFVLIEIRAPSPVFDLRLFRNNRIFAFSNLAALINYSATSAVSFLVSLYLQYIKGLPPQKAGLVLIAQPVVMAVCSPFAGRLSDKVEPRALASLGMGFTSLGLALFIFLGPGTPFPVIYGGLLLLGLGFGLFSSPNMNAIMGSVERRHYGLASASVGTMRLAGGMLSAGVTMMIFALFMGRAPIEPSVYPLFLKGLRAAFTLFALICAGGIFASLARGDRGPSGDAGGGPA
ncbi:MAG: MFS transporter [Candidatus Aminicenantes bacterium]|nr:MFS transporter [Candidatus Aminicenantes bacterium]